jgi:hypothetical protein
VSRSVRFSFARVGISRIELSSSGNTWPPLEEHSSQLTFSQPWPLQAFCPAQAFFAVAQKLCPFATIDARTSDLDGSGVFARVGGDPTSNE